MFDQDINSIVNLVNGIERDYQIDKMNDNIKSKKFGPTSPINDSMRSSLKIA